MQGNRDLEYFFDGRQVLQPSIAVLHAFYLCLQGIADSVNACLVGMREVHKALLVGLEKHRIQKQGISLNQLPLVDFQVRQMGCATFCQELLPQPGEQAGDGLGMRWM